MFQQTLAFLLREQFFSIFISVIKGKIWLLLTSKAWKIHVVIIFFSKNNWFCWWWTIKSKILKSCFKNIMKTKFHRPDNWCHEDHNYHWLHYCFVVLALVSSHFLLVWYSSPLQLLMYHFLFKLLVNFTSFFSVKILTLPSASSWSSDVSRTS